MIRLKNRLSTISILAATLAIFVSCATQPKTPPPEATPPPTTNPVKPPETTKAPTQEDIDKLLAQAKDLKKKAFDLKLFEVLPDDYKAADALLAKGSASYDAKDVPAAKDGLDAAITAFKDLISRGIVDIIDMKKKEAEAMKASAVKAGADSSEPERFAEGDASFKSAVDLVGASKSEDAIPVFTRAKEYYELAWKRAAAADLLKQITDKDFAKWDSGNFQLAQNKYQAEDGLWAADKEAADRTAGIDALDEAYLRFNLVLQKGNETAVSEVRTKTDESKQRSEEIKANVAAKDLFDGAQALYDQGDDQARQKRYVEAADAYQRAGAGFDEAYQAAAEKRAKAEDAMKAAAEATAQSQRKAEEAQPLVQTAPQGGTP